MKTSAKGSKSELANLAKNLNTILSKPKIEKVSNETQFQKRSSARISGYEFLMTLLSVSLDTEHATLGRIASTLARLHKKDSVSPQAVMKRLNREETVKFLQSIQEQTLRYKISTLAQEIPSGLLKNFSKVLIQDSTVFELNEMLQNIFKGSGGRASKSCGKLDVIYDLKSKNFENIYLTDQSEADSSLAENINTFLTKDTLVIRDLAYIREDALQAIVQNEAFFLSRFKLNLLVYLNKNDDEPVELAKYLSKKLTAQTVADIQVYITKKKIPVRMIAHRCPEEVAERRRREAHKTARKQGRTLRSDTISLMDFTIFVTNVPEETWEPEVVGTVYRTRWQIELLFKRWKSSLKINHLQGINHHRIRGLIYARLILLVVMNRVCQTFEDLAYKLFKMEISMHKVHEWLREGDRMIRYIQKKLYAWDLTSLESLISKCLCKQKRARLTTRDMIQQGEIYG